MNVGLLDLLEREKMLLYEIKYCDLKIEDYQQKITDLPYTRKVLEDSIRIVSKDLAVKKQELREVRKQIREYLQYINQL